MSVGGQLSRLSSVLYVLPPKFAQNYQKFPAQGCFRTSSVTVLCCRGRAGSVVRTNAKLRPAWRLMVLLVVVRATQRARGELSAASCPDAMGPRARSPSPQVQRCELQGLGLLIILWTRQIVSQE